MPIKVNLTGIKELDKALTTQENKYRSKIESNYNDFSKEAKRQAEGIIKGTRKQITINPKANKNLEKNLQNNLSNYFSSIEKTGITSAKKELYKLAGTKEEKLRIASLSAEQAKADNLKWSKALAERQRKAFETYINKALTDARKANPDISVKDLQSLIDDKTAIYKKVRLDNTILNESNRIQNQVRIEAAKQSGLVRAVIFIATLDKRTTVNCSTKHGTVIAIDDPKLSQFMVPQHSKCRSRLIYVPAKDTQVKVTPRIKVLLLIKENPTKRLKGMPV
jgi:SPP1 gp7 family putative phage head morphogenesis protein